MVISASGMMRFKRAAVFGPQATPPTISTRNFDDMVPFPFRWGRIRCEM
jgi:hypothetical protein